MENLLKDKHPYTCYKQNNGKDIVVMFFKAMAQRIDPNCSSQHDHAYFKPNIVYDVDTKYGQAGQ